MNMSPALFPQGEEKARNITSELDQNSSHIHTCPLRVALILDTNAWAGTESYVYTLAKGLRSLEASTANSLSITIATAPNSPLWRRSRAAGIKVLPIARFHPWDPNTLKTLVRCLRSGLLDVLHAHNGRTALLASTAVRLAGRGVCIVTEHFISPAHALTSGFKGEIKSRIHHWMDSSIAHHIAISHAVADALEARGEVDSTHVSVVHNGIEFPSEIKNDADALPAQLQAQVACIARLEKEKDVPTLVRAMGFINRNLKPNGEPIRCVIAGEGAERGKIEALIEKENLKNIVHLAGFTPLATDIMRAAQVCVLPSADEPFGLAVVEAMAQKRPVVATDSGGPREIVVEGQTGLLTPPGDAAGMARAVMTLLDDRPKARAMGEAGFQRFQSHFTSQRMAEETLNVYRRAIVTTSS